MVNCSAAGFCWVVRHNLGHQLTHLLVMLSTVILAAHWTSQWEMGTAAKKRKKATLGINVHFRSVCVCFRGGGAERLADNGWLEWMPPPAPSLYFPRVTFELSVLRGCISQSGSVDTAAAAAAGDESETVKEIQYFSDYKLQFSS